MNLYSIDQFLFEFIHSTNCTGSWWDNFNLFVTNNSHHLWFVFLVLIVIFRKPKNALFPALMCFAGFFLAWHLTDEYIKPLFERPRPFLDLGSCVFGHKPSSFSFPSGHTTTAVAIAALICLYNSRIKLICLIAIIFAAFTAYTRIYLGVHYPSDILGGTFFGIIIAYVWFYLVEASRRAYSLQTNESD